ncbi:2-keto-4-pentenoate hydratase [Nocardia aobensis]|uniref:2-keto-4-pentenoate hydratase n=1 Tax=Nocardia aobensis TaxID=257277 RepID=A0ABW6PFC2_9NOCA
MTTSTNREVIQQAADTLAGATASRKPCAPVRDLIGRDDTAAAYLVQAHNISARLAAGRTRVGRKVGLTSPAVQRQLGVDRPDFGVLLDDMDCTGSGRLDIDRLLQPRLEAEIAFVLGADIDESITGQRAPRFVERLHAAFEIVDSRVADWNISLVDTIADNASSGLYVLGDELPADSAPDLVAVKMTMSSGGERVSTGKGSDCLGSPWAALAWLANTSVEHGAPLRAGEVILSGALGPMVPVIPGASYTASITGIGAVAVAFTSRRA